MIIDLFSSILLPMFLHSFDYLPTVVLTPEITYSLDMIYSGMKVLYLFLPMAQIWAVVQSVLAIEGSILTAKIIIFVYNALRGHAPVPSTPAYPTMY